MSEKTPRLKCSSKATVYALNDHSLISCQKQGMFFRQHKHTSFVVQVIGTRGSFPKKNAAETSD